MALMGLWACQSETPEQPDSPKDEPTTRRDVVVTACLPGGSDTRAIIEYGYQDESREVFKWTSEEFISILNITKFRDYHTKNAGPILYVDEEKIDGDEAPFLYPDKLSDETRAEYDNFFSLLDPGDVVLVVLGGANPTDISNVIDQEVGNVMSYEAISTLYDQKIYSNPVSDYHTLKHMHMMTKMYDVVKVEEKGKVPKVHFKHMSAMFRVTLTNQTGGDLFTKPTDLTFHYPLPQDSAFISGFSYFSVYGNDTDGYYLKENFKKYDDHGNRAIFVTDKVTHKINEKSQPDSLRNGQTYELYAIVPPRIGAKPNSGEKFKGDKFIITLYDGVESGYGVYDDVEKYQITIPNFNTEIEPGKRYWFKLTACKEDGEAKLMFTSQWNALHPATP